MKLTNTKIIGITGGIASGKTTFSNMLIKMGYLVIDADKISRSLLEKDSEKYKEVVENFKTQILDDKKNINRKLLADIIFKDDTMKKKLENILHPAIFKEIKRQIDIYSKSEKTIFVDIPLLYEKYEELIKYHIYIDEVWLIYVDKPTQTKRLMARDNIDLDLAIKKINAQLPLKEKKKLADKIIYNTKDLNNLKQCLQDLIQYLH